MKSKRIAPLLPEELMQPEDGYEILKWGRKQEERVSQTLFKNLTVEKQDFSSMVITTARFENCRFFECSFGRTEFTDVVFKSCDLSGCDMSDTYFNRAELSLSKGVGTRFSGSSIQHMAIQECNLNYANFDGSKLEYLEIERTELNSSNFAQCRCKDLRFAQVQLTNASFFKTSLRGMDFSDSTITGLVLSDDLSELRGAVVDLYQAAELAKRLGIRIKDTAAERGGIYG